MQKMLCFKCRGHELLSNLNVNKLRPKVYKGH